ncbi:Hemicentin-1 [Mizuhopecten yessoensis]|uniref:Hemicentin-1 n=1 Tax=Mizuhopecten yessoensis TaxID=6573 RepID=A0A210Q146_MIZYE|nr:Hemicentin-1 [Mizuhopecten yessoensis]
MDRTTTVTSGLRTPIIFLMVLVPGILSQAAPSNPTISSPTVNTIEEGTVTFTCETEGGSPTPTVKWYKDNTLVDDTSFTDSSSGVSIHKNIYSANIQFSDKNVVFKCEVENSATSSPLTVTKSFSDIYVEPSSPVLQGDSAVQAGVSESWACYTNRSYPIPTITWNLDSQAFSQGISTSVSQNSDATYFVTSILTFTPVSGDNNKVLMCEIEHSQTLSSSIQRTITLQITGGVSKPAMTIQQTSYSATSGSQVTLQCTASGATSFSWLFNGTNVANNPSLVSFGSLPSPSLTILSMSSGNIGSYVCRGTNSGGTSDSPAISLSLISLPTVTVSQTSYNIVQGNTVTLACTVSGATNIFWQKIAFNGQTTTLTIDNSNYGGSSVGAPSLVIYNIDSNDQATYVCNGQNTAGTTTGNQITLIVSSGAPILSTVQTSYSVSTGTTVTLSCSYSSSTSVSSVYWQVTKGGTTTAISTSSSRFSGATVSAPSLQISSTQTSDSGSYRCFAVNTLATGAGNPITLTVSGGNTPNLTVGAATYSVPIGGSATLGCTITSSPAATSIFWSKVTNGASSTISTAGNSRYSGGTLSSPSLVITSLQSSDAGSYRCNAVNSVGTGQSSLTSLIATYAPQNTVVSPSSLTRDEGQTISATCTSDASPNPTFAWVKVSTNQQYGTSNTLTISSIDRGHDGDYRCTATNSQGSDTATMTVNVRYRPVSTVTSAQASVVLSSGQSQTLQCNTVSNPSVSSYSWTKDGVSLTSATSQNYIVTISASSDYGTYSCYATNAVGQSNAIPFAVSSGTTGTTSGPATGASTADTGLTSGTIAAIILAILFILLILLLVICCCCMKGVCGKKEKKKRKIEPTVIREEPKEIIRTIEIPRYVEKPFVYREPAYREPAYREPVYRETYREPSAVSRQDVVIAEENFDILKYQTVPPSGTSIDDSLEHNHRRSFRAPANLPALEYTVEATTTADDEERRRRRRSKKRRRRHREEGEGEEREHRSTSRRRHRRKRHEEVEGEPIITNGDVYYRNYSNNADTSEQYYYN